jgi:hypothetical protein
MYKRWRKPLHGFQERRHWILSAFGIMAGGCMEDGLESSWEAAQIIQRKR